nr:MAG TPA: putative membrane protein [Caudoviricetes sp.]
MVFFTLRCFFIHLILIFLRYALGMSLTYVRYLEPYRTKRISVINYFL